MLQEVLDVGKTEEKKTPEEQPKEVDMAKRRTVI